MNFLNDKIRSLKVQLEAEKAKAVPDKEHIRFLEDELSHCLRQAGLVVKK